MKNIILVYLSIFVTASTALSADVLIFSDNFNTADSTDLNADQSSQSGSIGNQDWDEVNSTNSAISSGILNITAPSGGNETNVYLDYDFSSVLTGVGEFTVSFDVNADNNYSVFYFGATDLIGSAVPNSGRPMIHADTDVAFRLDDGTIYQGGSSTQSFSGANVNASLTYEFTVTTAGFSDGTGYSIDLSIEGIARDLNGVGAGNSLTGNWDGGPMMMGFSTRNANTTTVDNFQVTAVIPEPSSMVLMLGGLSLFWLSFRHRRA